MRGAEELAWDQLRAVVTAAAFGDGAQLLGSDTTTFGEPVGARALREVYVLEWLTLQQDNFHTAELGLGGLLERETL